MTATSIRFLTFREARRWCMAKPQGLSIQGPTPPERKWTLYLADWQKSGLQGSEFCRKRRLSYAAFRFWKKEIVVRERRRKGQVAHEDPKPARKPMYRQAFIPVRVAPAPTAGQKPVEVLVAGRVVRVPPDFNPEALRRLLGVLESP
jgi:hypothetical protein